jgi:predicted DNA-binding antitoxin AbrB/MazE fold protein
MRSVEARYEDGFLKPTKPLQLRRGEKVGVIVVRHPDPLRWDLKRLAQGAAHDEALAGAGLHAWTDALDAEDRR